MDGHGRRLGWIAIAIGLLALGFALGSRSSEPRWQAYGPGYDQRAPAAPPAYQPAPEAPQAPQAGYGPRSEFGPGYGPFGHGRPGGMFFAPFFFIGGLIKLALLGLLLFAALRLFGGRRPGGPGGSGGTRGEGESERTPPEQPTSYTGGTAQL